MLTPLQGRVGDGRECSWTSPSAEHAAHEGRLPATGPGAALVVCVAGYEVCWGAGLLEFYRV